MALSTGQVNSAFTSALGRNPTGSELSQYTGDNSFEGDAGQQALIGKLKGVQSPGNSDQVQGFLNDYHNLVKQAADQYEQPTMSDQQIMDEVKGALIPSTPIPTAPSMVSTFASLRSDPSVTNLEQKLSDLKTEENTIKANTQASQAVEGFKPVAQNVIQGRQTEEQRLADVQLSSLADQKAAVIDELNTRYTMIDNIMKFTQMDYDNSLKTYETQFTQNQAVFDAFNKIDEQQKQDKMAQLSTLIQATGTEVDQAQKIAEFKYQQSQDQVKNASANLTIMANMIKDGNLNFSQLSSDQKLGIQKLEVQAGLGTGFIEHLTQDNANGKVVYAAKNGVIMQMPDGTLKSVPIGGLGGGGSADGSITAGQQRADTKAATGEMSQKLSSVANSFGNVSPKQWQQAISAWTDAGLDAKTFVSQFSYRTDPNRTDFDQAYGFSKKARSSQSQTPKSNTSTNLNY